MLEQRSNAYKAWVRQFTELRGIPVLQAPPKGVRKEDFVQPYYRRLKTGEGVACVLTSLEQGRTFVSYTPRWKVASGDADYRQIKTCRKRFLHYYWYVLDPIMGPMSIRVASYFPFNVTCYMNGHSFAAQELTREGIRFRKSDNAFLAVAEVNALQAAADRVTAAFLERRCGYPQGTERVGLRLLADGTSMLFLADGQGRIRANFYVNAPGTATAVQLFDPGDGCAEPESDQPRSVAHHDAAQGCSHSTGLGTPDTLRRAASKVWRTFSF